MRRRLPCFDVIDLVCDAFPGGGHLRCILVLDLLPRLRFRLIEPLLLFLRELFQEEQGTLHAGPAADEGVLRQADDGAEEGAVLHELADECEGGIVEDALRQDDAEAAAGLEQGQAALDEENFRLGLAEPLRLVVLAAAALRQLKQTGDGLADGSLCSGNRFTIGIAVDLRVFFLEVFPLGVIR